MSKLREDILKTMVALGESGHTRIYFSSILGRLPDVTRVTLISEIRRMAYDGLIVRFFDAKAQKLAYVEMTEKCLSGHILYDVLNNRREAIRSQRKICGA